MDEPFAGVDAATEKAIVEILRAMRAAGRTVSSLDLLLAAVALHHSAVLLSFDDDFEAIAAVSELQLRRLQRPV
jgi:predicted nucleic acid-binding protein